MTKKKGVAIAIIILLLAIYALNIVDYFQTVCAIQTVGIGVEANPIGRFCFKHNCAWAVKFIGMPIVLVLLWFFIKIDIRQVWAACFLFIFYCVVVLNNFSVLEQIGYFNI